MTTKKRRRSQENSPEKTTDTPFHVVFYQKDDHTIGPADAFIRNDLPELQSEMSKAINKLREQGNQLRGRYSAYLRDGFFELRARRGNNISRVLYFFTDDRRAVLTNGYRKKDQRMPNGVIELAKKYRSDFLRQEKKKQGPKK